MRRKNPLNSSSNTTAFDIVARRSPFPATLLTSIFDLLLPESIQPFFRSDNRIGIPYQSSANF